MKRDFIDNLIKWAEGPRRRPLVLSGARQVGKTWLLNEFGRSHYAKTAYLNFDRNEPLQRVFDGRFDKRKIISELELETNVRITPGDTLVILDEIQVCGNALSSLKYWNEQANEYHVAAAGSLVGLSVMDGTGYPVGKTDSLTLYPMSFSEFLAGCGEQGMSEVLKQGDWETLKPFSSRYEEWLRRYLVVGGMPAAVDVFSVRQSFADVQAVQRGILSDYRRDFAKHAPKTQLPRIRAIWDSLPRQLAREDRRFVSAEVEVVPGTKTRSRDLRDPFEWLEAAGVVSRVWNVTKPAFPLAAYRNHTFKLFGVDVGLLAAQSGLAPKTVLEGNRVFTEFKGALTEQFVQQELRTEGFEPYTWAPADSKAEVDFLVEGESGVIPIEAKAERNLRAKSLQVYRERFAPAFSIRTSLAERVENDGIRDIPLYQLAREMRRDMRYES